MAVSKPPEGGLMRNLRAGSRGFHRNGVFSDPFSALSVIQTVYRDSRQPANTGARAPSWLSSACFIGKPPA